MKTLNELIKSFELSCGKKDCGQCPYDDECLDHHVCECYERMNDALHYLKEYWEKQKILKGKWQITSIKGEIWGVCSNCGFKQKAGELNFCPNCGVDMRGNDETNKN